MTRHPGTGRPTAPTPHEYRGFLQEQDILFHYTSESKEESRRALALALLE